MSRTVAVIGGGVAGLTAALGLASRGYDVTVLDEADRLGGRLTTDPVLLLFGCHTATWALLEQLHSLPLLRPLKHTPLEFLQPNGSRIQYSPLPLPSPLNTLIGTTLFQGLSMRDRWHLLAFLERTWERDPPMPDDLEMQAAEPWLAGIGQSETARHSVWNPLSRLMLGGDLENVSASLFMRTLRRYFFTGARASKIIVPSIDASRLLVAPLIERLTEQGVSIRLSTAVTGLRFSHDRVTAVEFGNRDTFAADSYVIALPFPRLRRLLPERIMTHYAYFQQLGRLRGSCMVTVHLQVTYCTARSSVILLPQGSFHWCIARPSIEERGDATDLYLVATGNTGLFSLSDAAVLEIARADIAAACPPLSTPSLTRHAITRDSESLLSLKPGTQQYRPLQRSPFPNLFLAGDWTDTGWPANLESAIESGNRCVAAVAM
jgi:squalene-associated FAD-dependent desaturase